MKKLSLFISMFLILASSAHASLGKDIFDAKGLLAEDHIQETFNTQAGSLEETDPREHIGMWKR